MTELSNEQNSWQVVINLEEQYSIWPIGMAIPYGWRADGKIGSKEECLEYIKITWTDMRPLSLRKLMEANSVDKHSAN